MLKSSAISPSTLAPAIGSELRRGVKNFPAGNLDMKIAVLAEANTANQSGFPDNFDFTDSDSVGIQFGYGSPCHRIASILRPPSGDSIGTIKTTIVPQTEPIGATPSVATLTVTGTATGTSTHFVEINGRSAINGASYNFSVLKDDDPDDIRNKIIESVNSVQGAPVIAATTINAGELLLTTKWAGKTAEGLDVTFLTGDNAAGVSYAVVMVPGAGLPVIDLSSIESDWYTVLINSYGAEPTVMDYLNAWNGTPQAKNGRYDPIDFKPALAFLGTHKDTIADLQSITSAQSIEVTNVVSPAPSPAPTFTRGWDMESAANDALLFAVRGQESPHLSLEKSIRPDMPYPSNGQMGDMGRHLNRNELVGSGVSVVLLDSTAGYEISRMVSTYHPTNIDPLTWLFSDARYFLIHWNIQHLMRSYYVQNVQGKTIVGEGEPITVGGTISVTDVKAGLTSLITVFINRALITDEAYSKEGLTVALSPNRIDVTLPYKLTTSAMIIATLAFATFDF